MIASVVFVVPTPRPLTTIATTGIVGAFARCCRLVIADRGLPDRDPRHGFAAKRIVIEENKAQEDDKDRSSKNPAACGSVKGSRKRRLGAEFSPSGVLRSSVVSPRASSNRPNREYHGGSQRREREIWQRRQK